MLSDNGSFYIYNISSVVYCLGDTKSPKLTQTSIYNKGIHLQGGGGGVETAIFRFNFFLGGSHIIKGRIY